MMVEGEPHRVFQRKELYGLGRLRPQLSTHGWHGGNMKGLNEYRRVNGRDLPRGRYNEVAVDHISNLAWQLKEPEGRLLVPHGVWPRKPVV